MTNGIDHNQGHGSGTEKPQIQPKPTAAPKAPTEAQSAHKSEKRAKK